MWREQSGRPKLNHMSLKGCPPKPRGAPDEAAIFRLVQLQRIRSEQGADLGGELPARRAVAHLAHALDARVAGVHGDELMEASLDRRQLDPGDVGGGRARRPDDGGSRAGEKLASSHGMLILLLSTPPAHAFSVARAPASAA